MHRGIIRTREHNSSTKEYTRLTLRRPASAKLATTATRARSLRLMRPGRFSFQAVEGEIMMMERGKAAVAVDGTEERKLQIVSFEV